MRSIIVIPVYNDAAFLDSCLRKLNHQTLPADRVIVVDNNSTDNSVAIAEKYDFVTVVSESTQGICAATKTGFDAAAHMGADIILRCDADSRPNHDWVERTAALFDNKNIIAATGPGVFYDISPIARVLASVFYMKAYFWSVRLALGQNPLFGSNCAIRADAWKMISDKTHLTDQTIHDDVDLSYHLSPVGKIQYDPKLTMPISGRPFKSFAKMARRYKMGLKSITIHWPEQSPWRRVSQKIITQYKSRD